MDLVVAAQTAADARAAVSNCCRCASLSIFRSASQASLLATAVPTLDKLFESPESERSVELMPVLMFVSGMAGLRRAPGARRVLRRE